MPDKFNELLLKQDIIELYNAGITPDYGYLMNGRFEKDMVKTLYPLKTLSGNPISWEASDTEYLFPVVSLEPKQAGTGDPSPDNVRPISGYDEITVNARGKNLVGAESPAGKFGTYFGVSFLSMRNIPFHMEIKLRDGKEIPAELSFGFVYTYEDDIGSHTSADWAIENGKQRASYVSSSSDNRNNMFIVGCYPGNEQTWDNIFDIFDVMVYPGRSDSPTPL